MSNTVGRDTLQTARDLRTSVFSLARNLRLERQEQELSQLATSVLIRLHQSPDMTPRALATAENAAPQTMTRVLATLEERRLISRRPDPSDGRQSLLILTLVGRRMLLKDSNHRDARLAQTIESLLTPAEQQMLAIASSLLGQLTQELQRTRKD